MTICDVIVNLSSLLQKDEHIQKLKMMSNSMAARHAVSPSLTIVEIINDFKALVMEMLLLYS